MNVWTSLNLLQGTSVNVHCDIGLITASDWTH